MYLLSTQTHLLVATRRRWWFGILEIAIKFPSNYTPSFGGSKRKRCPPCTHKKNDKMISSGNVFDLFFRTKTMTGPATFYS